MRVIKVLDETKLGKYNDYIHDVNIIMECADELNYFTPYDFDQCQKKIDEAVNMLCGAIKDGSLLSGKLFVTKEYENKNSIAA